jgi:RHS repeat-associated protein
VGPDYYWYVFDKLGTPWLLVDSAGTVVWKAHYDSFGAAAVTVSIIENNLRLPGQYFDAESGLHYNWNRYYDPSTGRYLSRDPVRDETNHYLYAQNDPLTKFDPDGLRIKIIIPIGPCAVYTSLDGCECGVKCGPEFKAFGTKCKAQIDLDLCNGRGGGGPGGLGAPKLCANVNCDLGKSPCKAGLFKVCYDFQREKLRLAGPLLGCKAKGPGFELEGKSPPIARNGGPRDSWGY